jgi:hypothetical protein
VLGICREGQRALLLSAFLATPDIGDPALPHRGASRFSLPPVTRHVASLINARSVPRFATVASAAGLRRIGDRRRVATPFLRDTAAYSMPVAAAMSLIDAFRQRCHRKQAAHGRLFC